MRNRLIFFHIYNFDKIFENYDIIMVYDIDSLVFSDFKETEKPFECILR